MCLPRGACASCYFSGQNMNCTRCVQSLMSDRKTYFCLYSKFQYTVLCFSPTICATNVPRWHWQRHDDTPWKDTSWYVQRCVCVVLKAHVRSISLQWEECLSDCTSPEMKENEHTVSELQYKYRFMHTMKASFPIFWLVSQHCYNALLYTWATLFFTYEYHRN